MALGLELAPCLGRDSRLQGDRAAALGRLAGRLGRAEVTEPGRIAGLLDVHAKVDQVADHLRMALGLHVTPHQAEAQPGLAVLGDETGDDRVKRSLAGLEPVEMVRVEREERTAVLEREAQVTPARDATRIRENCSGSG